MFDETFLLETETARDLYERFARPQPIIDYHCHLPPEHVASFFSGRHPRSLNELN